MKALTPIILILVSIGVFLFFIDPQRKELDALSQEFEKNEQTIERAGELRRARGILQESYNRISEDERKKLLQILPDTVDNVRLILDINNIAKKSFIVLKGISISGGPIQESTEVNRGARTTDSGQLFGTIQLSFSFSASYETFKVFMKDLEDSRRLIDITNFSVSSSDANTYNYSITLNTYWLR